DSPAADFGVGADRGTRRRDPAAGGPASDRDRLAGPDDRREPDGPREPFGPGKDVRPLGQAALGAHRAAAPPGRAVGAAQPNPAAALPREAPAPRARARAA